MDTTDPSPPVPLSLVILIGLPGAGKTTFYRQRLAATHEHVSMDLLRNNPRPGRRQLVLIEAVLAGGRSVAVDNTNPLADQRASFIALGRQYGAAITGYSFTPDLAGSLARNRTREGRARVPDIAIYATRKRLEPPTHAEGYDQLYAVRIAEDGAFEVHPLDSV